MLTTFAALKNHLKLKATENNVAIDNIVFRLHYRITFLILIGASVLVTSRQYIGEHIRCILDSGVPANVIERFCFFMSTYTVVKHMNATSLNEGEIPHPGIGPTKKEDAIVHHAYYQWVPYVLFFQAILFYLPHYLWKSFEGGRLKSHVSGLYMACIALNETKLKIDNGVEVPSRRDREEKIKEIRRAFKTRVHMNKPWAYYLTCCELLNFLNLIFQVYFTNYFLGGVFFHLNDTIMDDRYYGKMNPLDVVFPKMTKCTFHKYGPSGTIQQHDALCVMALNVINEKIYVVLWFWFMILFVLTVLGLLWRLITMFLHANSTAFNKYVFQMACPGKHNPWNLLKVTRHYYFSDWLFLYYLAKNLDNYVFKDLLVSLAHDLEDEKQPCYKEISEQNHLMDLDKTS